MAAAELLKVGTHGGCEQEKEGEGRGKRGEIKSRCQCAGEG